MFEVTVEHTFAAGHSLREYKGKCENVHGHNYRVQVTVEGERLNRIGLLVDFVDLKRDVRAVCERLDHQFINDLEPFTTVNPSAENIAKYLYDEVTTALDLTHSDPPVRISQVKVWETDTSIALYRQELVSGRSGNDRLQSECSRSSSEGPDLRLPGQLPALKAARILFAHAEHQRMRRSGSFPAHVHQGLESGSALGSLSLAAGDSTRKSRCGAAPW